MSTQLHHLIGNTLEPIVKPSMIIHCCNSIGAWGKGFVVSLSQKYPETKEHYLEWFKIKPPHLGEVQFVQVTPEICVANMIAQKGIRWEGKIPQ